VEEEHEGRREDAQRIEPVHAVVREARHEGGHEDREEREQVEPGGPRRLVRSDRDASEERDAPTREHDGERHEVGTTHPAVEWKLPDAVFGLTSPTRIIPVTRAAFATQTQTSAIGTRANAAGNRRSRRHAM